MRIRIGGLSMNPVVFVLFMPFYMVVLFFGGFIRLLASGGRR